MAGAPPVAAGLRNKGSTMLYLVAFFMSPLAVLLAGKPVQAFFNGIIYMLTWFTVLLLAPAFTLWAMGGAHACFVIHGRNADRRTAVIADAIRQAGLNRSGQR